MSDLDWIISHTDRVGVVGILAFALLALYREWIVLGKTHRECRSDRDELKQEIARYLQEDAQEKAELRHEVQLLRQSPPRRRSP